MRAESRNKWTSIFCCAKEVKYEVQNTPWPNNGHTKHSRLRIFQKSIHSVHEQQENVCHSERPCRQLHNGRGVAQSSGQKPDTSLYK